MDSYKANAFLHLSITQVRHCRFSFMETNSLPWATVRFKSILSKAYGTTHVLMRLKSDMAKQARLPNRIIEYHDTVGVSIEADPRHCDALIRGIVQIV